MSEQYVPIETELERLSPITTAVVDAFEAHLSASAKELSHPKGRKPKKTDIPSRLPDLEIAPGITKQTLLELRSQTTRGLRLCYKCEFGLLMPEGANTSMTERKTVALDSPRFFVVGPHGEGEKIPQSIQKIRRDTEKIDAFSLYTNAEDYIASGGKTPSDFNSKLDEELREINYQFGNKFPTDQFVQKLKETHPNEANKFFLAQIERQISQYEGYCKEYRGYYEDDVHEMSSQLVFASNISEIQFLENCLKLLKEYLEKITDEST